MQPDLAQRLDRLTKRAEAYGLRPYPVDVVFVPMALLHELSAYGVLGRFGHWARGKLYHRLKVQSDAGLLRLYEVAVQGNPTRAYLWQGNSLVENTLVLAHVLAHSDFFRQNAHCQRIPADTVERIRQHAERVRRYEESFGLAVVEETLDHILSVEWYVAEGRTGERQPEDLLGHLLDRAPLADWQQDLVAIVREESLAFWPLRRSKILNEGWASFWHATLLREELTSDAEYVDFARLHADILRPGVDRLNPYLLGFTLIRHIVHEHGLEEAFLVRESADDRSLVENHFDDRVVEELQLVVCRRGDDGLCWTGESAEVRRTLLRQLENAGQPVIRVAGEEDDGTLVLVHAYDGRPLHLLSAERTLGHLAALWNGPVSLETVVEGRTVRIVHDGRRVWRLDG